MNFDLDDPLGDILSDGSNDSFFESTKKGIKPTQTVTKPMTPSKENKQTKMADLFGIKKDESKQIEKIAPNLTENEKLTSKDSFEKISTTKELPSSIVSVPSILNNKNAEGRKSSAPSSLKSNVQSKKSDFLFDDNNDIDLGFNLKKLKSKTGVLDDLLGFDKIIKKPLSPKVNKTLNVTGRPNSTVDLSEETRKIRTRSSAGDQVGTGIFESDVLGTYAPSVGRARSGRRGSPTTSNDPLGLFTTDEPQKKKLEETKSKSANWLGLNTNSESNLEEPKISKEKMMVENPVIIQQPKLLVEMPNTNILLNNPQKSQILALSNQGIENAMEGLNQQEIQIMLSEQVKNQETALIQMQNRQHALIVQQETQFNDLLQKQLLRQHILEENIKQQQDRINSHIQILLLQPTVPKMISTSEYHTNNYAESHPNQRNSNVEHNTKIEINSEMKRIELENLRLENLITNVNANHEQELNLLDLSYRKQISILNEYIETIQLRLNEENQTLEEFYKNKLGKLEREKENMIQQYEKKYKDSMDEYDEAIKKLKTLHNNEIEELKIDHRNMIENIRQSKLLEFSVVQENTSYIQMLKTATTYLESATGDLEHLRDNMQEKLNIEMEQTRIQLELKRKSLDHQQTRLDKMQENVETEKTQLLDLVKTLEIRLDALTKTSVEEEWIMRQKITSLDVEKTAFHREREFFHEQKKMDEKKLEELKKYQQEEFKRKFEEVQEEKIKIIAEKSKLETMSRLQQSTNQIEPSRIEIDSAIKVAQDAARQSDIERERLLDLQRKCENRKRELIDQENIIREKEVELSLQIKSVKTREKNVENALAIVKQSEKNFKAKLQILQKHSRELSLRESNLSKEKYELSHERIELQSLRKKLYENRCSLCKIGEKSEEITKILSRNEETEGGATSAEAAVKFDLDNLDVNHLDKLLDLEVEQSMRIMNENRDYEIDVDDIPNITDMEDELLDPQLLLIKLDALSNQGF